MPRSDTRVAISDASGTVLLWSAQTDSIVLETSLNTSVRAGKPSFWRNPTTASVELRDMTPPAENDETDGGRDVLGTTAAAKREAWGTVFSVDN